MTEMCISPLDKSRKAVSTVLQVLKSNGKQGAIAAAMGLSDSTMSRLINDHLEQLTAALYHAGFKVVAQDMRCYPAADVEAWYAAYRRQLAQAETAKQLFGGDE